MACMAADGKVHRRGVAHRFDVPSTAGPGRLLAGAAGGLVAHRGPSVCPGRRTPQFRLEEWTQKGSTGVLALPQKEQANLLIIAYPIRSQRHGRGRLQHAAEHAIDYLELLRNARLLHMCCTTVLPGAAHLLRANAAESIAPWRPRASRGYLPFPPGTTPLFLCADCGIPLEHTSI